MLLLLLCVALSPAAAQITDLIDWEAYLTRHDPVWTWGGERCTRGYNVTLGVLPHSPGAACGPPPNCTSPAACVEASARLCDACAACAAFALSPAWRGGLVAQLFAAGYSTPPNAPWTLYAKGGPALGNHSSCAPAGGAATEWEDGAFLGNGLLGALVLLDAQDPQRTLRIQVGRSDVADVRVPGGPGATGSLMFDQPRLPVGSLGLRTAGNITSGAMRIHLHNATLSLAVNTTAGALELTLAVHRTADALLLAWRGYGGEAVSAATGEGGAALEFFALPGNSTRRSPPPSYAPNPPPTCTGSAWGGGLRTCAQDLLAGGGYATALATAPVAGSGSPPLLATVLAIANDGARGSSAATAAAAVRALAAAVGDAAGLAAALEAHAAAWRAWWPAASFVTLQDTVLEATWVLQMYKYGCAARAGGPAMDLMGPWWQTSGWEVSGCQWGVGQRAPPEGALVARALAPCCSPPSHILTARPRAPFPPPWQLFWFDMNVPEQYAALAAARRFDELGTLSWMVNAALAAGTLSANVRTANGSAVPGALGFGAISSFSMASPQTVAPGQMLGHVPWLALPLYQHAAYTANASAMRTLVFPYLKGAVNTYLSFAVLNASDGLLHLPPTASPEYPYPDGRPGPDAHYDLALFQWGLRTLLELNSALGLNDALAPAWAAALARLAPLPVNEHGFMVDATHGFDVPHRHFSHLFAMYPLHLLPYAPGDGGTPASQALFAASLDRWTGLTCGSSGRCPNGFTYDGAASISALVPARAAAASGNLSGFVTSGLMHAATLYSEGRQPCMESPVAAAAALQEMLLQSWGGRVRVFPGAPWPNASFYALGAEGGLVVSAVRAGGAVAWVGVEARDYVGGGGGGGGGTRAVALVAEGLGPASGVGTQPAGVAVADGAGGALLFEVPVGELVVLFPASARPQQFAVQALPGNASDFNYWGKREE